MQIRIRVRPRQGYHYPYKIDDLEIDSSARLETIQENYSTQGSTTRLYYGAHELPLNSSIGSHNLDDGAIIECCRSPGLAAALSACLKDLDAVKKLRPDDRHRQNLMTILQTPPQVESDPSHDIWKATSWSDDSIKSRIINFATMKAVLQRQDRYQIKRSFQFDNNSSHDYLEEFVIRDHSRHAASTNINTPSRRRNRINVPSKNDDSESYLAYLATTPPRSTPASDQQPTRRAAAAAAAYSSPLTNNSAVSTPRSHKYIPQYASAPFSVLATLHLAMHAKHKYLKGRKLTLTEEEVKRLAQPTCRSNLYDKMRIRGRNAFACMDGLIEKKLVRKEIVRNPDASHQEIEKWGLLPDGELMGQYCSEFERAVRNVIPKEEIGAISSGKSMNVVLCMDSREDVHYLERIRWNCEDESISCLEKELPAGDYLFFEESLDEIVPLVIERKSWSDLADSCLGRGRARNRLDCVSLNSSEGCAGNCQLCKMKRCGCTQILFIIEGERCQGMQRNQQCSVNNCCSACKLLSERHNITQTELEGVLTSLQLEHGCFIHYAKSFNDTVASLFSIRTLLQSSISHASQVLNRSSRTENLPFEVYKSNSRRKQNESNHDMLIKLETVHEWDIQALASVLQSSRWDLGTVQLLLGSEQSKQPKRKRAKDAGRLKLPNETILLDSDSDNSVIEVDNPARGSLHKQSNGTIYINSDSDEEISVVGTDLLNKSDDSIIILDDAPVPAKMPVLCSTARGRNKGAKRKVDELSSSCIPSSTDTKYSILIFHQLSQYENKLGKKLDATWRSAYLESDGVFGGFYDKSLNKLNEYFETSAMPRVHGRTIATFSLWLQIIMGTQVRFVQGQNGVIELRQKLDKMPLSKAGCVQSNSWMADDGAPNNHSTSKTYTTPLQASATSRSDWTAPRNKSLKISLPNDAIREARLRRFDRSVQSASTYDEGPTFDGMYNKKAPSSTNWSCTQCTLENELHNNKCAACGFQNPSITSDVPLSSSHPNLDGWSCPQ
eukprot:scaffold53090_cov57-Cyclotella_meneghiniana.AAC.5